MSVSAELPGEVGCYTLELQEFKLPQSAAKKGGKSWPRGLPHHGMGLGWGVRSEKGSRLSAAPLGTKNKRKSPCPLLSSPSPSPSQGLQTSVQVAGM